MKERTSKAQGKRRCTYIRALLAKGASMDAAGLPTHEEVRSHADRNLLGVIQWYPPALCSNTVVAAAPDSNRIPF